MNDKLELLALSDRFKVTKTEKGPCTEAGYEIESLDEDLGAFIDSKNKITYYVTGCYNSGLDWINFDIKQLEKLKNFCELMVK